MSDDTPKPDANSQNAALREAAVDTALEEAEAKVRPKCDPGTPRAQCRTWGEKIYKYQKSVGIAKGTDYCVAFVYWCFDQAAKTTAPRRNPLPRMSGAQQVADLASRRGCFVFPPKPGDVFILYKSKKGKLEADHVGFVRQASVDSNGKLKFPFSTVEGNTYQGDHLWGVWARERKSGEDVDYRFARF
ncbi:MAG: CHAP domain-containing protein [Acidithiobacillales bacterium]